jgi:hypothetical protein
MGSNPPREKLGPYSGFPLPDKVYVPGLSRPEERPPEDERWTQMAPAAARQLLESHWAECRPYLFGFDLLNSGAAWEAHVAWEALWKELRPHSRAWDLLLRSLIRVAAAVVRHQAGSASGRTRHAQRALEVLREAQRLGGPDLGGITREDVASFLEAVASAPTGPFPPPRPLFPRGL